jgi:acid phosphatase type 7
MRFRSRLFSRGAFALGALGASIALHAETPPERLFLQQVSDTGAIVKWRGGDARQVCYSTNIANLYDRNSRRCVDGVPTEGGHMEARLTRLASNLTYYYSLGDMVSPTQKFRTAPDWNKPPRDGNTHILVVGDSGTQTEGGHDGEAAEVLAGFNAYNAKHGNEPVDLFLALGDTAYLMGTDEQWQKSFFEIYPEILKSAAVLPTIGNHEMGYGPLPVCVLAPGACQGDPPKPINPDTPESIPSGGLSTSSNPDDYDGNGDLQPDPGGMPYLNIFSLPTAGESGGLASGTEQYYSVDYGNVHVVSLDSQVSARDPGQRETMKQWLIADLAGNDRDWTIVIFHHPPYTKGANHDSDEARGGLGVDQPEWDMRNEFTPIFEDYGVDVVYSGHSHSYERSYYLRGHRGTSDTFAAAEHAELNGFGDPALGYGNDTYDQVSPTSGGVDDRVVYTVAGSSGKADKSSGLTDPNEWLLHPAHVPQPADSGCTGDGLAGCRHGLAVKGSVVVDASFFELTAKFVDVKGEVLDQFTIKR